MKLHEYQAKEVLAGYGVPVPEGRVTYFPDDAWMVSMELGLPVVLKAQVLTGGRGKAGGVKIARTSDEVRQIAQELFGKKLVTKQTGPEGVKIRKLLVEKAADIERELYFSIVIDRTTSRPTVIASKRGGMSIEEVAEKYPEDIIKIPIDPAVGFLPYQIRRLKYDLDLMAQEKEAAKIFSALYKVFVEKDCSLLELNPLVVLKSGHMLAVDAKMDIDDNALYRRKEISKMRDLTEVDPDELEARFSGLNFIKLTGNIGCMVNGAGLAMTTMDVIKLAGGDPANFLDVGGEATPETIAKGFEIITRNPSVKAIFINIFGGIVRCDKVANGIIQALKKVEVKIPVVIRLTGMNKEEGMEILKKSPLKFYIANDLREAAKMVSELANSKAATVEKTTTKEEKKEK
ncbi:ADP-forming succinate--CoA ligase subunit beta [Hippea maritima]|uniref:Succinate--CoA ligase [ADP-forming] subunit beta n=1 Tax=Hippea maritima (strain ATCC 700847 / DSM 10411 / MH2) TaxID=760142 RepID=F2LY43_HIPMA|nr:ADP-forming succinate--CoA ligase subunit beta [Hippea maritima]AEA34366.1 Succinyl-CoA ligase (ADP-forming) subunit beta [Hippea maritima DSM 10411]